MLRNKTVFILGAGASSEVKLPLGWELKAEIAKLTRIEADGRYHLAHTDENRALFDEIEQFDHFKNNKKSLLAASRQISAGVPFASSIDSFLEIRKDNLVIAQLAKMALVHLILQGERKSNLRSVRVGDCHTLEPTAIDGTWYQEFIQLLFEKVGVDAIESALDQLAIIDFNYDRCLEQVLFHAFTGLYNLPHEQATVLLTKMRIFHPYGTVGALHKAALNVHACEFGGDPAKRYGQLSNSIRTFSERMGDTGVLDKMQEAIGEATTLVFLGCAFHSQNTELIRLPSPKAKIIFGTTYGMSQADKDHVEARLKAMFSGSGTSGAVGSADIKMENMKCAEFLRHYRRALSAD